MQLKGGFFMDQVLIKEKKYSGKYVIIKDYGNPVVVAYGKNPEKVYRVAIRKKCADPILIFVPTKNMVHIY